MSLVRFDPLQELDAIQARLGRLFPTRSAFMPESEEGLLGDWLPATDVQETEKEFLIKADLPEVAKNDVKVHLQDGVLTIEGERRREKEETKKTFHKMEREYGRFIRRFVLPTEVDAAKVQAEFKDGVLNVRLPKSEKATPKTIEVKVS
jgi:HSP20 family protein